MQSQYFNQQLRHQIIMSRPSRFNLNEIKLMLCMLSPYPSLRFDTHNSCHMHLNELHFAL